MNAALFRFSLHVVQRGVLLTFLAVGCLFSIFPVDDAWAQTKIAPPRNAATVASSLAGQRFSATRQFSQEVSEDDAATIAETAARAAAMQGVVRALVSLPEVRISSLVAPASVSSPNLLALAHATIKTSVLLVSKSRKTSAVTVTIVIDGDADSPPLGARVREALVHTDRRALYEAAVLREKVLLEAFDTPPAERKKKHFQERNTGDMPETTTGIVNEIRALNIFVTQLPSRDGLWKDPEAVYAAMRAALELAPESAICRNAMGEAFLQMGRSQEAMEQQTRAIRYFPSFARAYHSRGAAALALGLHSSAIADFSEAIRLSPRTPAYYRARGMARHLSGETPAMCRDLYQACTLGECDELQWAVSNGYCPGNSPS